MEFEKQEAEYFEKLKVSYKSLRKCICVNTIKIITQPIGFHLLALGKQQLINPSTVDPWVGKPISTALQGT